MSDAFLHIYSAWQWHDSAHIIGNEVALKRLRDAIDNALENGDDYAEAYTSDGEGFCTIVVKADEEAIDNLSLPYQDEVAKGQTSSRKGGAPGGVEPWDLESVQKVEQRAQEKWQKDKQ